MSMDLAQDLFETTKPRILLLVILSTLVGFLLATEARAAGLLFATLIGTALVCASCNSLNQLLEKDMDAKMQRTRKRPLPAGRLTPLQVLIFGCALGTLGLVYLAFAVNLLTALLGALSLGMYLFIYTPLKRKTPLCTLIGAVPGAAPVLMGWTAGSGTIDAGGWILFSIIFLWQLPHFFAIATMYREDYAAADFPMLPVRDMGAANRQIVIYSAGLLLVSLSPTLIGLAGMLYLYAALALGVLFLALGIGSLIPKLGISPRMLFFSSIVYLPVLLTLLVVDKI